MMFSSLTRRTHRRCGSLNLAPGGLRVTVSADILQTVRPVKKRRPERVAADRSAVEAEPPSAAMLPVPADM